MNFCKYLYSSYYRIVLGLGCLCLFLSSCTNEGEIVTVDGIDYKIENGIAYVINGTSSCGVIHSKICISHREYNVKGILPYSFQGKDIKQLYIEEGVKFIGESAFADCKLLENIQLPSSVSNIEKSAFYNCIKLSQIQLSDSLVTLGDSAFMCTNLVSIVMPSNIKHIGNYAFKNAKFLSVAFPASLKHIGDGAFLGNNIQNVYLFKNVEYIGDFAFGKCPLRTIFVEEENAYYTAKNGYLIDKKNGRLIASSAESIQGNAIVIPNGVKELCSYSIWFNSREVPDVTKVKIKEIVFPESLKLIHKEAICVNYAAHGTIKPLYIPSSVENIEEGFIVETKLPYYKINNSTNFAVLKGVLFDKNLTRLISYPNESTRNKYSVPESVLTIDSLAFCNCYYLEELNTGKHVRKIKQETIVASTINKIDFSGADSIMRYAMYFMAKKNVTCVLSENLKYIDVTNIDYISKYISYAPDAPTVGGVILQEERKTPIYVLQGSLYSYQANPAWSSICDIQVMLPESKK